MHKQEEGCCEFFHVHEDTVKNIEAQMPEEDDLAALSDLFKVFGDFTRIKILYILSEAEVCVCDLAQLLSMTQSAVSHQLKVLKQAELVKTRREGKSIFYSLADSHVSTIIGQGMEHVQE